MTTTPFKVLGTYQNDIGNLRSHHWKYWVDMYTHCYYDCAYCVYRAAGKMGKVEGHPERIDGLQEDLRSLPKKGIVYLGPRADVYQPMERRLRLARRALEVFLETETPVFVVTRSELLLADLDVMKQLATKGLIEISITLASTRVIDDLEPNTLSVRARLELIRELRANGIPVSVHMSPIIPTLDTIQELTGLLDDIHAAGSLCTYACMLGVTSNYEGLVTDALALVDASKGTQFRELYPTSTGPDIKVRSAPDAVVLEVMEGLSRHSRDHGIPFACVHVPPLDTVEREGSIFRYKIPTVGDIARHFARKEVRRLELAAVLDFVRQFDAVDADFLQMVERFWCQGILFKNTYYHPVATGQISPVYVLTEELDIGVTNMKVT